MEVPRPTVPRDRLADWEEIDATVEEAFSTPIVTVYTHTVVYEEATERDRIRAATGVDLPWRFFFSSRIRLAPDKRPSQLLTPLVRRKAAAGFTDRLADRGFEQISERRREETRVGGADGLRVEYRGVIRHEIDASGDDFPVDDNPIDDDLPVDDDDPVDSDNDNDRAVLTLPVAAVLAVWAADGDYHVAGGGYPAEQPDSGPPAVTDALGEYIDPTAARETLDALIDSCGPAE